jgi:hypothetical protein
MEMSEGKFGDIIKQARKPENQKEEMPADQTSGKPENQEASEKEVNLCVKVPISLRRHWSAEAKRQGITMTSIIVEALTEKFGLPD